MVDSVVAPVSVVVSFWCGVRRPGHLCETVGIHPPRVVLFPTKTSIRRSQYPFLSRTVLIVGRVLRSRVSGPRGKGMNLRGPSSRNFSRKVREFVVVVPGDLRVVVRC